MGGVLDGLRVVEVAAFIAAPLAGTTLAGLGAEVIRVEQRGGGIDAQRWPVHAGRSLYRAGLDRGKRSLTIDLRSDRGQALVTELVCGGGPDGGILITNLAARGWMAYERLRERRPDLVMVVVKGTAAGRSAVDYTVNAGIGFPLITGSPGADGPVNHVLPAWDIATGVLVATAVLAAERRRRLTGIGSLVEVALAEVAVEMARSLGYLAEAELVAEPRGRFGNDLYGSYGRDFRTGDGRHVMVCALTARQWQSLQEATGIGSAVADLESATGIDLADEGERFRHRAAISELVGTWIGERPLTEVAAAFDHHEVLWGPYRTFKELVQEPSVQAEPASPLRFIGDPEQQARPAPEIGADTEMVLRDELGLAPTAIAELRAAGVID